MVSYDYSEQLTDGDHQERSEELGVVDGGHKRILLSGHYIQNFLSIQNDGTV